MLFPINFHMVDCIPSISPLTSHWNPMKSPYFSWKTLWDSHAMVWVTDSPLGSAACRFTWLPKYVKMVLRQVDCTKNRLKSVVPGLWFWAIYFELINYVPLFCFLLRGHRSVFGQGCRSCGHRGQNSQSQGDIAGARKKWGCNGTNMGVLKNCYAIQWDEEMFYWDVNDDVVRFCLYDTCWFNGIEWGMIWDTWQTSWSTGAFSGENRSFL